MDTRYGIIFSAQPSVNHRSVLTTSLLPRVEFEPQKGGGGARAATVEKGTYSDVNRV